MATALEMASHFAAQPTQGLAAIKRLLNQSLATPMLQQLENEKQAMHTLGQSKDYQEAVAAFFDKRKPIFTGE